ncbi:MAG: peptidoglycan DD-metalloendopeptidase family protein [Bacteroidales bacterium]|nr:peptidoglycan DD-metalloendopeptidase family protein [Bacteroidales bacterium]
MRPLRIIAAALLTLSLALPLQAQNLTAKRDRKARLEKDIRVLEGQLSDATKRSNSAATQLDLLHAQSQARRELLQDSERELKTMGDSVRTCQKQIDVLQSRLDTMTHYYGKLVRNAYKNRDARAWYLYILASDNLAQGMRRYGYLRELSSQMNTQGRRIIDERKELEAERMRLDSLRTEVRKIRDERATELGKLRKEEEKSRSLVSQLQKDRRKYQNQLSQKRKEVEALNREIERLISAAMGDGGGSAKGKGKAGGKKTTTKIDLALSNEFSANKGKLPWPADGRVVSHFGRNPHPVYTKLEMPFNNGVGIALEKDAPVKAVFNGVVKQIVVVPGYNQCILIQHGEYFTFYCKMGSVAVKAGDKVKTGEVLGHVATSPDGTQLHFQLWKGRDPQDPEKWLR